ncbi:glycosyltransferase family 8 protein [Lacticaseibacillus hulanensis]|uniref:glycosyltransferase family 8 protein n=1 Tax=Lacticaseibacillus hulanensis TaxID=2493111 RepID=UPI000FDC73A8|nr:glycosyltransferase family 8 protein [Lacticaseibacillus hulanensis]
MNILFTLNSGYLEPLKVALTSIHYNNDEDDVNVWLIHESIPDSELDEVARLTAVFGWTFHPVMVDGSLWQGAPTEKRYPKEMYFRLLAGEILPGSVHRVLYLDPDVLVINSLMPLWNLDLEGHLLAAATHTKLVDVTTRFNNIRLKTDHAYYNSGIMLIDLDRARTVIHWEDIKRVLDEIGEYLMLPDQDILNHLYGSDILKIPDERWNYDARSYGTYFVRSRGEQDIHWVMANTSILHFNGKPKPWMARHDNRFTALYLSYSHLMRNLVRAD